MKHNFTLTLVGILLFKTTDKPYWGRTLVENNV